MEADLPGIQIGAGASIIAEAPDGPVRIRNVIDGMSHTFMVIEDAGQPGWYGSQGRAASKPLHDSRNCTQGGGAWADPLNYIATNGGD